MAGLLDSLRPILGGTAAFAPHYRRQDQAAKNEQMQGLLDMYGRGSSDATNLPRSSSSPNMGPQGLMGGGQQGSGYLPPQFYQEAGMLPGNQRFLAQDQLAGQNMQAQMQEQDYNRTNMSAYDAAQLAQRQSQFEGVSGAVQAQLNQQQAQYETMSPYDTARLEALKQQTPEQKPAFTPTANMMIDPSDPTGMRAMVRPGSQLAQTQETARADMDRGIDTIDEAIEFADEYGSTEYGDKGLEMTSRLRQTVQRALQVATEAKTLGEEEALRLSGEAWDFQPTTFGFPTGLLVTDIPGSGNEAKAALRALRKTLGDQRDAVYRAQGKKPPIPPVP